MAGGAPAATIVRPTSQRALGGGQHSHHGVPAGLGLGAGLPCAPHVPQRTSLRRMWTMAKPAGGDVACNVLPFLLDITLGLFDTLDIVKSSVDSEVVFQATLQVPAHHAMACRISAYGTPFAAPDLQAAAGELQDEDLEFAACLASPPDLDEQLSVNFGRVMSLLEQNRGGTAGAVTRAAPVQAQQNASAAQQLRAPQAQQQLQQAPKVLVSVDDAEAGTAQLQRSNSAKRQPKFMSMAQGYGRRAMQALLGFGYLLTVLHEKHLGGHIEFTAAALTAAGSGMPSVSKHTRQRRSTSSGGRMSGVMAGLRQMVADCPSLNPKFESFNWQGARQAGEGAALAAAAGGAGVLSTSQMAALAQRCSGSGAAAAAAAAGGLDSPFSPGIGQAKSFDMVWDRIMNGSAASSGSSSTAAPGSQQQQQQQQQQQEEHNVCRGLQLQLSLSAPLANGHTTSLDQYAEQLQQTDSAEAAAAAAAMAASLSKTQATGGIDSLLDDAIQQAAGEPSSAATPGQPAAAGSGTANGRPCSSHSSSPSPFADLCSQYMPDQTPLTSPLPPRPPGPVGSAAAAATGGGPPPWMLAAVPGSPMAPQAAAVQATACASPATPRPAGASSNSSAACPADAVPPSPRILRPMLSLRLTCSPKWIAGGEQHRQPQLPSTPERPQAPRPAVHMHQDAPGQGGEEEEDGGFERVAAGCGQQIPQGLWPTVSFSLSPVRLQPSVLPGRA